MSVISVSDNESYLDQNPSICQLLRMAKRKLQGRALDKWFVWLGLYVENQRNTEIRDL